MTTRRPLFPASLEEAARIRAGIGPRGVDQDNDPIGLTPEEKRAARDPGKIDPNWKPRSEDMTPLVPPKWAALAGFLSAAFAAGATIAAGLAMFPRWVSFALWAASLVTALLAGAGVPEFRGPASVPVALVPLFLSMAGALVTFGTTLTPGTAGHTVTMGLAAVCAALGGKALPLKDTEEDDLLLK